MFVHSLLCPSGCTVDSSLRWNDGGVEETAHLLYRHSSAGWNPRGIRWGGYVLAWWGIGCKLAVFLKESIAMRPYQLHHDDLPDGLTLVGDLALDTETTGLSLVRDRLCLVQLSDETGQIHLVKFTGTHYAAPNLRRVLLEGERAKIFHFARFDVAMFWRWMGVEMSNIFCTKIASKLVRTYTDRHGLKDVCNELLGVELSKQQQSSDWGNHQLTDAQLAYAASDVLHLHKLRDELTRRLEREKRLELAQQCFHFLPTRAKLDCLGWEEQDIFAHGS